MTDTATTETMRLATIRREAARRGAADDTVEMILDHRMVVSPDGEVVERVTGRSIDALLDEMQTTNPKYFSNQQPDKTLDVEKNPFVPGPNWNFTEIMRIWKTDPERAEHLEYLASIGRTKL